MTAPILWSLECAPPVSGGTVEATSSCCEFRVRFSLSGSVPVTACSDGLRDYWPNRCDALNRQTGQCAIGPFAFPVEVTSGGIDVDDELIVNGSIFEPNSYSGFLAQGNSANNCSNWPGGESICNVAHNVGAGVLIATLSAGDTLTIAGGDNHGISLSCSGSVTIKPAGAP